MMTNISLKSMIWTSRIGPFIGIFLLAACENGVNLPIADAPASVGITTETVETDVAAPEAFSISDVALWDGRPTFGGVWLAYPDVETPERVRISNADTGKTVIGALYKRERQFPGPKIELSADAAMALGVLAGNPTKLNIVALRRKKVEVTVEPPADPFARPADIAAPVLRQTAAAPEAATTAVLAPKPSPEPAPTPPIAKPTPATPEANVTPAVSAVPLPPVSGSAPGIYIQVATLQTKAQVDQVTAKLERAGLRFEIRNRDVNGKTLYRIVVGPATSEDAFKIMMGTVHALGFKDAIKLG